MKISELIEKLTEIKDSSGDLQVAVRDNEYLILDKVIDVQLATVHVSNSGYISDLKSLGSMCVELFTGEEDL